MKLFIDTGNLKEIESLVPLGIIDGITTNPSLLAKEGGDYRQILKRICQTVKGPTSAEVVSTDADGMIREGRDLASIDEHIVVKVPFTKDGVKACRALASDGIRVNVTLIFSATQALFAAKVGATFISPFVGRLDDAGLIDHLARCRAVVFPPWNEDYGFVTVEAFMCGKPVITCHDSGGPAELVHDGENGLVTPPAPEALAHAMRRVIEDRNQAMRMGEDGARKARAMTWPAAIQQLLLPVS